MTFQPVLEPEPQARPLARYFFPDTGSEREWNAAFYRLEDYLRALQVINKVHQSQIILEILQAAAAKHRENPDESPTTLAMQECHQRTNLWFEEMLERRGRFPIAGLLPMFLADGAGHRSTAFLRPDAPDHFRRALKEHDYEANPDIQVSRMIPRPLDVSPLMEGFFHDGWEKLDALTALIVFMTAGSVVATVFFFMT
jgi:hypothetical protein